MSQVPTQVLQWLYNALLNDYRDAQRTYSDTASVLGAYPTLSPRTDVYTYNSGQSALLLCLSGTLPVNFRGTVYRFPITIWIPQAYPRDQEGIIVLVTPGDAMAIRPGQHVGVDGRVYHPYLKDWTLNQRSSIAEFLHILQDVFAREPPVVARQQQSQQPQQIRQPQAPGQRPPPPPKERNGSVQPAIVASGSGPPPKPPKPGEQERIPAVEQSHRSGPPLPPLPNEQPRPYSSPRTQQPATSDQQPRSPAVAQQSYSANGPPPLPPLPHREQRDSYHARGPASPMIGSAAGQQSTSRYQSAPPLPGSPQLGGPIQGSPPAAYQPNQPQAPQQPYAGPAAPPGQQTHPQRHQSLQQQPQQYMPQQQQHQYPQQHQNRNAYSPQQQQRPNQAQPQQPPKPAGPPPDLLTDPFDITLSTGVPQTGPAPPIPPNPEKEHLLSMLSTTLISQLNQKIQQNQSALTPLRAQNQALQDAHAALTTEFAQLQHLDATLASNEQILHRSLRDCDVVIETSKSTPAPPIDDVLVVPTVAAQQLWNLVADEAAIREALWCLQQAVNAGRVGGTEFVRLTRGLAREAFLKMALARKVAVGLGLDVVGGIGGGEGGYYA